jgi:hypothetical protein
MPTERVVVAAWNVQNFGSDSRQYPNYKGMDSVLLAQFISAVVEEYDVDVLLMMEVFRTARPHLDVLLTALNAPALNEDWCYDWVKGSVKDELSVTPAGGVDSRKKLDWTSSGMGAPRAEGYAVFWRDDQHARFAMQAAALDMSQGSRPDADYNGTPPGHCLSLSLWGRDTRGTGNHPPYVQVEHGFVRTRPSDSWTPSHYPDVAKVSSPYVPSWPRVRRPAYVVLRLNVAGGDELRLCPIVVYHAPSTQQRAETGTYISGLARELYVLPGFLQPFFHRKFVAAGDYNLTAGHPDHWDANYRPYWRPFALVATDWDSGAASETALSDPTESYESIVAVRGAHGGSPIDSDEIDDYLGGSIDNLFQRGLDDPDVFISQLPFHVMQGGKLNGPPVQAWYPHLLAIEDMAIDDDGQVTATTGPEWGNGTAIYPNMTDWAAFKAGVQQGYFNGNNATGQGDARSCAVFIHDFVSDHFPVFVDFEITTP